MCILTLGHFFCPYEVCDQIHHKIVCSLEVFSYHHYLSRPPLGGDVVQLLAIFGLHPDFSLLCQLAGRHPHECRCELMEKCWCNNYKWHGSLSCLRLQLACDLWLSSCLIPGVPLPSYELWQGLSELWFGESDKTQLVIMMGVFQLYGNLVY